MSPWIKFREAIIKSCQAKNRSVSKLLIKKSQKFLRPKIWADRKTLLRAKRSNLFLSSFWLALALS